MLWKCNNLKELIPKEQDKKLIMTKEILRKKGHSSTKKNTL